MTTHFTARVRLVAPRAARAQRQRCRSPPNGAAVTAPDIYRIYFHGPAYQVLERVWRDGATTVGLMAEALPDNHTPPKLPTLMAPRLIELCFQTAGIWEIGTTGRMGLPQHIDRVSAPRIPDASSGRLYAVVTSAHRGGELRRAGRRRRRQRLRRAARLPHGRAAEPASTPRQLASRCRAAMG